MSVRALALLILSFLLVHCGNQPKGDVEAPSAQSIAPTFATLAPKSPGNTTSPVLSGKAYAGATIAIFSDSACSAPALGIGTAGSNGGFAITLNVPANTTTQLYGKGMFGTLNSPCIATSLSYTEDSIPPATPVVTVPAINPYVEQGRWGTFTIQGTCSIDTDHLLGPDGAVIAANNGTWSYAVNLILHASTVYTFYAYDPAGNPSPGVSQNIQWAPGLSLAIGSGTAPGGTHSDAAAGSGQVLEGSVNIHQAPFAADSNSNHLISGFNYIVQAL